MKITDTEIIVTELRPMSDLPKEDEVKILAFTNDSVTVAYTYHFSDATTRLLVMENPHYSPIDQFIGWLPMPVYRPEN